MDHAVPGGPLEPRADVQRRGGCQPDRHGQGFEPLRLDTEGLLHRQVESIEGHPVAQGDGLEARGDARAQRRRQDITGAVIQAAQFLSESDPARKTILILSDIEEDLDAETIRDVPIDLAGIEVVAVNVIKLRPDNLDPTRYHTRIVRWRERVLDAGATSWQVVNELDRLAAVLGEPA